jgi:hypothetical protein
VKIRRIFIFFLPFMPLAFMLLVSYIFEVTEEYDLEEQEDDENFIKVAVVEDKAYWIIDNILYEADFVDGEIEKEYARPVDAFEMDYVDVNRLMSILDDMQDWKN